MNFRWSKPPGRRISRHRLSFSDFISSFHGTRAGLESWAQRERRGIFNSLWPTGFLLTFGLREEREYA